MKKGRTLATILALLMTLMMLAACAPQTPAATETAASDTAAAQTATEAPAEEAAPVTITYFNTSAEVNSMFEAMFARYHELNPNVTIELIPTGVGEGQQRVCPTDHSPHPC